MISLKKKLIFFFYLVKRYIMWTDYVLGEVLIIRNNLSERTSCIFGCNNLKLLAVQFLLHLHS